MQSRAELPPLLLRADADLLRGTGSLLRCVALAQAWRASGGAATMISRCENPALRARFDAAGVEFVSLRASDCADAAVAVTRRQLALTEGAVLAVDGERFGHEQQRQFRMPGHPLLVVDPRGAAERYEADVVLKPAFGASAPNGPCPPGTTVLSGPDYALLRPEFTVARRQFRSIRTVARKILFAMGAADADNVTLRVLEALERLPTPGLEIRILAGPANAHAKQLVEAAAASSLNVQVVRDAADVTPVMAWADIAVADAGSTSLELACLGLPAVVLALNERQTRLARELDTQGVAHSVGWHRTITADRLATVIDVLLYSSFRRLRMSQQGRTSVDGHGAERVVQALRQHVRLKAA